MNWFAFWTGAIALYNFMVTANSVFLAISQQSQGWAVAAGLTFGLSVLLVVTFALDMMAWKRLSTHQIIRVTHETRRGASLK